MQQHQQPETADPREKVETSGSSVATHRRGERMRTYHYQPRPEGRM